LSSSTSQAAAVAVGSSAGAEALAHGIGGTIGVVVDLILLAALAVFIYIRSRGSKVDPNNVNAEWTGSVAPAEEPTATAAA
jgi:PiT family inorganic phosphate transporter